jgi:hypothetical protein
LQSCRVVPGAPHSDDDIEAAIQALMEPGRLERAQRTAAAVAPQLQTILNSALNESEYFGSAHREQVLQAAGVADPDARVDAVLRLISEETRIAMLIGVAVGMELAAELGHSRED